MDRRYQHGAGELADSIADVGWDLNDQAERYVAWWTSGACSVNGRVLTSASRTYGAAAVPRNRRCDALGRYFIAGQRQWIADAATHRYGAGRCWLLPHRLDELIEKLMIPAAQRMPAPMLSAYAYFGVLLCGLLHGLGRDEVLSPDWPPVRYVIEHATLHPEVQEVALGQLSHAATAGDSRHRLCREKLGSSARAFHDAADFRQALLRAVNLGDDADTTGAVCGQLAGAAFGEAAIPEEWAAPVWRGRIRSSRSLRRC